MYGCLINNIQFTNSLERFCSCDGRIETLHNEERSDFYSSLSIIRIKSMRMIWAGHVARMFARRNAHKLLVERLEGKNN
jgi:hypothetical protein